MCWQCAEDAIPFKRQASKSDGSAERAARGILRLVEAYGPIVDVCFPESADVSQVGMLLAQAGVAIRERTPGQARAQTGGSDSITEAA